MIPQTEEDKLKSKIIQCLEKEPVEDLAEYIRIYRKRCEEMRHLTPKHSLISKIPLLRHISSFTLEEKLLELVHQYHEAPDNAGMPKSDESNIRRKIDKKAYKLINSCKDCRKNHRLRKYYLDMYGELKLGRVYIEDKLEDAGLDDRESYSFDREKSALNQKVPEILPETILG